MSQPFFERQNSTMSGNYPVRLERQSEEQKNVEALVRQKIEFMDTELERLKRKGEDQERVRIH